MTCQGCTSLREVDLGNSMTSIGVQAFYKCSSLENIDLPDTITRIDDGAFMDSGVRGIYLPESLVSLGSQTFNIRKESLVTTIDDGIGYIGSRTNPYLCAFMLIDIEQTSYKIHEGCKIIYGSSFGSAGIGNLAHITSVIIPDGVVQIGPYAMFDAYNIEYLIIPESVQSLGMWYVNANTKGYYLGGSDGWESIIGSLSAMILENTYFYSETEPVPPVDEQDPTRLFKYWHYVNDEMVIWE